MSQLAQFRRRKAHQLTLAQCETIRGREIFGELTNVAKLSLQLFYRLTAGARYRIA